MRRNSISKAKIRGAKLLFSTTPFTGDIVPKFAQSFKNSICMVAKIMQLVNGFIEKNNFWAP